jgi:hypothetical protein
VTPPRAALPDVIGAFESLTTVAYFHGVRAYGWPPIDRRLWQRSFHDRVVRDGGSLRRIREYVAANPARWRPPTSPRPIEG